MRAVFAAGGTAGHINPALAAAGGLKERFPDCEILFIGTKDKMEARLVPDAGFEFRSIDISGFWRSFDFESIKHNISTASKLLSASKNAKKILREFKPDVVVGFGGYVSGPVLMEAARLGIPTAIHEQNALPGVTNKALAKKVDCVMLTNADAEKRMETKSKPVVTGLPVRGEMLRANREESRAALGVEEGQTVILSMGGSLGADTINNAMVSLIGDYIDDGRFFFVHSTGSSGLWVKDKLIEKGIDVDSAKNLDLREYINDMDICMSAADLVICRAGASSLAELEALGKASILIPSPTVAENHQYFNALSLSERNAAELIEEKDLTSEKLRETFEKMAFDEKTLALYGENAKQLAVLDARERIVDCILALIEQ